MHFLWEISLLASQQIRVILQHYWVINAKEKGEEGDPCDIDTFDAIPVVDQIWPVAQKIIS